MLCSGLDGRDYSITRKLLHIPPLVVSIRQEEHRATCRARGQEIVDRVADKKRIAKLNAEMDAAKKKKSAPKKGKK